MLQTAFASFARVEGFTSLRAQYAAAVPAAWPSVAQVFITRWLPNTTCEKDARRPASIMFVAFDATSDRRGVLVVHIASEVVQVVLMCYPTTS
mmetsp:Transcript_50839/g.127562  ORF Transcript_50839/g.127562 Transcript_50839/m.127562 type:complete len:93 (+) Transcript_50839:9-287(+)